MKPLEAPGPVRVARDLHALARAVSDAYTSPRTEVEAAGGTASMAR